MRTPDFAFPKDVVQASDRELADALKANQPVPALRSLMNLTIAQNLISRENVVPLIEKIDSISSTLQAPFNAVGWLLEAQLYSEIYNSDSWRYDGRTVDAGMEEKDPFLWDKKLFARKIYHLTDLALGQQAKASEMSLLEIEPLVDSIRYERQYRIFDFIVYKTVDLRKAFQKSNVIPFYADNLDSTDSSIELVDKLISLHSSEKQRVEANAPLVCAIHQKMLFLPQHEKAGYLWDWITALKSDPWSMVLMQDFYSYFGNFLNEEAYKTDDSGNSPELPVSFKDFYALAKQMEKTFADDPKVEYVRSLISNIEISDVSVDFPSLISTNREFEVKVTSTNRPVFYVLLLSSAQLRNKNKITTADLEKYAKVINCKEFKFDSAIPFKTDTTVIFKVDRPGVYSLIVSSSRAAIDILTKDPEHLSLNFFNASDIEMIADGGNGCFTVDAVCGSPIKGADVTFATHNYNKRWNKIEKKEKKTTDASGFAKTKFQYPEATANYKGSTASIGLSNHSAYRSRASSGVNIFTDRKTYRPGDEINFMAVVYDIDHNEAKASAGAKTKAQLINANYETVDSLILVTDEAGRIFGKFRVPEDGLLGSYSVKVNASSVGINVEEYKVPSLLVTLAKSESKSDSITFKGKVATYSGMPLANLKVDFNVDYSPFFFYYRYRSEPQEYAASVRSDDNGDFEITLPLGNLDPRLYRGSFTIRATATDNAGETATSNSECFWIKNSYSVNAQIPETLCIDSSEFNLNVPVKDVADLPAIVKVGYKILNTEGATVADGVFESPRLTLDASKFASGKYKLEFNVEGQEGIPSSYECVFYRSDDMVPPISTALWVPTTSIDVPTGSKTVRIDYGSSFADQAVLCVIGSSQGTTEFRWLRPEGKNSFIEIKAPADNEKKFVNFLACRDHQFLSSSVTIIPACQLDQLEIATETFRNSLNPGEEEKWKFRLDYASRPVKGYAYAVLYDKAMDAIAPLYWNSHFFYPSYPNPIYLSYSSLYRRPAQFSDNIGWYDYYRYPDFDFKTYSRSLFREEIFYRMSARSMVFDDVDYNMAMPMANMEMMASKKYASRSYSESNDMAVAEEAEEAATTGAAAEGGDFGGNNEEPQYRAMEMPVAFFKPDLTSSEDGIVDIEFTVPDFNTTWKFMMGAYTPQMAGAQISLEAIASKKVMVKMLPPRFLRTGDQATITATLFNNSDAEREIYGVFEIFNPLTDEVIKRVTSPTFTVKPSGNEVVSISYDCPTDISALGLRVYAKGGKDSDGEQTVIPVLPSSQPIVESDPFYLAPGQTEFSMPVPSEHRDACVTLKYSDNPTWEILTALPSFITPDSESVTSLVYALYANSVGCGLLKKFPNLAKGLEMMLKGEAGDSILVSNLEKDPELKTVALHNTPWVNNARNETLRMSSLGSLMPGKKASAQINNIWDKILKLQNSGGGWSWCPQMKPTLWPTEIVLINLALLKGNGYLPELSSIDRAVRKGLEFCDQEYVTEYNKLKDKNKDWFYGSMRHYLFTRSFFPDEQPSHYFMDLQTKALDYLEPRWRDLSIFDKATLAIMLWRYDRKDTASTILESIRQFASESPEKGVWFDNLDSSWGGANKMLTTARVLTAFNEIMPSDPIIDKIRQWILIQRQAQDFQEGLFSVDVIDAMLSSGTEWTGDYPTPEISIGAIKVAASEFTALTGECKIDIDLKEAEGKDLEIRRFSPTPAWGGIISQYVAPMLDVKADAIEDLRIEKEFWKIIDSPDGKTAVKTNELNIGDKVRVSLIIECGRDMDYVALTDQRPACLEPIDQLSGYDVIDGLWCYHETRNSATNLFFSYLPKGHHVVTYECRVMEAGVFTSGVAIVQSQYAPTLTAHSAGQLLNVKEK